MPVRSLRSSVLKWPDRDQVEAALSSWADTHARSTPAIAIGYFGSYARGNWGVGSDVDIVIVVKDGAGTPAFERRASAWDVAELPVPADVFVYTETEWSGLMGRRDRLARVMASDVVWLRGRPPEASGSASRP